MLRSLFSPRFLSVLITISAVIIGAGLWLHDYELAGATWLLATKKPLELVSKQSLQSVISSYSAINGESTVEHETNWYGFDLLR
jgi:hypothetical protein